MTDLNSPSFFRKGGLDVADVTGPQCHLEVGRDPASGDWYADIKRANGIEARAVLRPDQAFALAKGLLISMARFQPDKIGEIRTLFAALLPHQ